jgi:parvulin-like peptidyl-prolyl cis-trans isomerase-like protein
MRISLLPVLLLAASAIAAPPPPEAPLVTDKGVTVDVLDFNAAMQRIPEERRADFRTSYDRVVGIVDNLFVMRTFAARARALGLDKDPITQRRMQQAQDDILADAYGKTLRKDVLATDLEQRAREIYAADKDKFVSPESVHVLHILIGPNWRTREMARARADEVYAKLKAGEDFLKLAAEYSDDPEHSLNKGDLGLQPPTRFVAPLRDQIAKMSRPGEISPPVASDYGFHIVKFVEREPKRQLTFDEVKKGIMAVDREKLVKQKLDAAITEVRSSTTSVAHRDNVEALVIPIDPEAVKRGLQAQEALARQAEELAKNKQKAK